MYIEQILNSVAEHKNMQNKLHPINNCMYFLKSNNSDKASNIAVPGAKLRCLPDLHGWSKTEHSIQDTTPDGGQFDEMESSTKVVLLLVLAPGTLRLSQHNILGLLLAARITQLTV